MPIERVNVGSNLRDYVDPIGNNLADGKFRNIIQAEEAYPK
jgi:hypothetical protein